MTAPSDTPSPTPDTEQVLLRLLTQVQHLNERVQRLEEAHARNAPADLGLASQEDLLEVQLHSARVAAELSRVTIELRSEIADTQSSLPPPPEFDVPDRPDADVIDLTATHPSARRRNDGWIPEPVAYKRRHTDQP